MEETMQRHQSIVSFMAPVCVPIHSFSIFIVSRIIDLKSFSLVFHMRLIAKVLLSFKNILHAHRFSLFLSLFSSHTFSWACRSLCEPQKFSSSSLFVHSLVCQIIMSIMDFSQTCVSTSPMYSMFYLSYYFQPEVNT